MTEKNSVTRRAFIKKLMYASAALMVAGGLGVGWKLSRKMLLSDRRFPVSPKEGLGLPRAATRWFTAPEMASIAAIASLIIPSDGNGPGADDLGVAGLLDELVAASPDRQRVYRAGLLAFDDLAMEHHKKTFFELDPREQIDLFKTVDEARKAMDREVSTPVDRATRKLNYWYYYHWIGVTVPATEFSARVVHDVKTHFYSNPQAWAWLGYEGPPFPTGYFSKPGACASHKV